MKLVILLILKKMEGSVHLPYKLMLVICIDRCNNQNCNLDSLLTIFCFVSVVSYIQKPAWRQKGPFRLPLLPTFNSIYLFEKEKEREISFPDSLPQGSQPPGQELQLDCRNSYFWTIIFLPVAVVGRWISCGS